MSTAPSATIKLAQALIRRRSLTPHDEGCQKLLIARLEKIGFTCKTLRFDDVDNLWARRGTAGPLFVFSGHTDVVPTGPVEEWNHAPFDAHIQGGYLYGRGAADMKGSLAAMITSCENLIKENPDFPGSIAFLITSDEEGPSINGTRRVMEWLADNAIKIDWCLVGEPSSTAKLGDSIKVGRRGSLSALLTVQGIQGHIAYPEKARNPIHDLAPVLKELCTAQWDMGNQFFPPTSFQISNIESGTGVENVIPGTLRLAFNLRYSTETTAEKLQSRIVEILEKHDLNYTIDWHLSGKPFLTTEKKLIDVVKNAVFQETGYHPECVTSGGTSDGRFIAPTGAQLVELGPINDTIHKINECVSCPDLDQLSLIYQHILENIFNE